MIISGGKLNWRKRLGKRRNDLKIIDQELNKLQAMASRKKQYGLGSIQMR